MSSCNQNRLSKQQNFENCYSVPSPLFFCKIVEIEDFALLVAILDEGQIYLAAPLGTYETKMAARTGQCSILAIKRENRGLGTV